MSEKKMVSRNVAIALGIVCILLIAGLGSSMAYYELTISDKNNTISSSISQISTLNNTIATQDNQISQQNDTINELMKLENLTTQISYMHESYDAYGNWLGSWSLVATFNENSVSAGNTSNFQIFSQFGLGLWRLNYTLQQSLWFNIIQVVGSQTIDIGEYPLIYNGGIDHGSVYYFQYSIRSPSIYYIEFPMDSFAGSWTITVEQLNLS